MARRNRIIYQSKALFISPNATGVQIAHSGVETYSSAKSYSKTAETENGGEDATSLGKIASGTGLAVKLDRVQNLNFGFTINAQDINEMGKLARLTRISNEPPTVNLDYSYYITDGMTERLMGFVFGGTDGTKKGYLAPDDWDNGNNPIGAGALSGFLEETQGQNYYIMTVEEGQDVVNAEDVRGSSVVSFGNGFVTNYELNATVGELPVANVSVEAFNVKVDRTGDNGGVPLGQTATGVSPGIDLNVEPNAAFSSTDYGRYYSISQTQLASPGAGTGYTEAGALRPGDIIISTDVQAPSDDEFVVFDEATAGANTMQIQSFNFALPLARTVLNRLGSFFGYNRIIDVPLDMEISISAFATEFTKNKNLYNTLCGNQPSRDFTITLNNCADAGEARKAAISYKFKGAILVSENHSVDIGGNETVDLTYSMQIGGSNDTVNGLFMSGSYLSTELYEGNLKLQQAYPLLDAGGNANTGFSGLVANFFRPGIKRNY